MSFTPVRTRQEESPLERRLRAIEEQLGRDSRSVSSLKAAINAIASETDETNASVDGVSETVTTDTGNAGTTDHDELSSVTADQHHAQAHEIDGADHTVSSTEGHLYVVQAGGVSGALEAPGTHVIRAGVLASRPAAGDVPAGTLYLATNDAGGILYRSTGAAWIACGAGVNANYGARLGSWGVEDASSLTISDMSVPNADAIADAVVPALMSRPGTVTGIALQASPALLSGHAVTATVYKNGVAQALTVALGVALDYATAQPVAGVSDVTWTTGDLLEIRLQRNTPGGGGGFISASDILATLHGYFTS